LASCKAYRRKDLFFGSILYTQDFEQRPSGVLIFTCAKRMKQNDFSPRIS
jgi:hypothetical protein